MNDVEILDCTLRDGGYLIDSQFGDVIIKGIIDSLTKSGVDIIEVGFLKDDPHKVGSTIFNCAKQIVPYLPDNKSHTDYVCLADYSRYTIEQLEPFDGSSINGVRACFFKNERYEVIDFCKVIQSKGYRLYVQPVDILGYSDSELLDMISCVNKLKPYAFSIVDTFGSMYPEDLVRLISLINHNLEPAISIGFHSHNNLQMSFSLAQEFVRAMFGKRKIFIDSTLAGMGRGAGNANTELVMNYLNRNYQKNYDLNTILDSIDNYILGYKNRHNWGYSIPLFLAGVHSAHVNNIDFLLGKSSIESRDINCILDKLDVEQRKRYNYEELERLYQGYMQESYDDEEDLSQLKKELDKKEVLIILPGHSIVEYLGKISKFYECNNPVVISVNIIIDTIKNQKLYFNNVNRYKFWQAHPMFGTCEKIVTSNVSTMKNENQRVIDYRRLIQAERNEIDNSAILLLRLLDHFKIKKITLAGFDGFNDSAVNYDYAIDVMEKPRNNLDSEKINKAICESLSAYIETRKNRCTIDFITPSRFECIVKKDKEKW